MHIFRGKGSREALKLQLTVMMYSLTYGHALVKTLTLYPLMDGGTERRRETKERKSEWMEAELKGRDGVIDGKGERSGGTSR